jgi:hypothetical protein
MRERKSYRIEYTDADEIEAKRAAKDLVLVRLGLDDSEIAVEVSADPGDTHASGGCRDGNWCPPCRKAIQREARSWLKELSETYPMRSLHHRF